jgi:WD40 repeat protein
VATESGTEQEAPKKARAKRHPLPHLLSFFDSSTKVMYAAAGLVTATVALCAALTSLLSSGHVTASASATNSAVARLLTAIDDPGGAPITQSALSPDGQILATCCGAGGTSATGGNHVSIGGDDNSTQIKGNANSSTVNGNSNRTSTNGNDNSANINGNSNKTSISGSDDTANVGQPTQAGIYLWDLATRSLIGTLNDPDTGGVNALSFSPDGRILAVADGNGHIYLWNVPAQTIASAVKDNSPLGSYDVAPGPAGSPLATDDGLSTCLWNPVTGVQTATVFGMMGPMPSALAFSPSGDTLAAGTSTGPTAGDTYLWDTTRRTVVATLNAGGGSVAALAFSPDGNIIAVAGGNGIIALWDTRTHRIVASIRSAARLTIDALAFDSGELIAVGHGTGATGLWDLGTVPS